MKKTITKLMAALALLLFVAPPLVGWGQTRSNATLNIQSYAQANNWTNGTKYTTASVSPITFTANGGSNTGKYYTNGYEWRYYQTESASITISTTEDYTLSSITFTYNSTNSGVLKSGNSTIASGSSVSVSGTSATFTVGNSGSATNGQVKFTNIVVTYSAVGGNPVVATPTFTPNGGSFLGSQEVSIACATDDATIYYTLDGNDPTTSSTEYSVPFTIDETKTVKAIAVKDNYDDSEVATAVFTKEIPMTVAEARVFIDNLNGATSDDVFVIGTISQIDSYNSNYNSITYWISDDGTTTDQLEVYSGKGLNGADFNALTDLTLQSEVIVKGKLKLYNNSTYEFTQNSQIVSLTLPNNPYIEANNVEITYNTDMDEIEYTINNPVAGGVLTAASQSDWLMVDDQEYTDSEGIIEFLCDTNDMASARTATVTLTYSYGDSQTVTKDVTVTQEGDPNIVDFISDITEVGTSYKVRGTVVAINSRGFIMGDGTGYVYYYKGSAPSQSVGDMVTVLGTIGEHSHVFQFTNSATVEEASSSNYNNTPTVEVITEIPNYTEGNHLSTYLQFEGALTKTNNNYFISLGEAQIQVSYPTSEQGNALTALDGKQVLVKGYFAAYNTNEYFTVMLESVEEIVVPSITVTPNVLNVNAEEHDGTLGLTYENLTITDMTDFDIQYYNAEGQELNGDDVPAWIDVTVAEQDPEIGEGYVVSYYMIANDGEARSAYFKVFAAGDEDFVYSNLVTINQDAYEAPVASITITPATVNLDAEQHYMNLLDLAYENIEVEGPSSFTVHYYNAEGEEIELVQGEAWLVAGVVLEDDVYQVLYAVVANYGEARTIYLRVSCGETYSNLVTINQAAPVLDYAVLPFVWEGGSSADFLALNGVTANGLGNDYASGNAPYLIKFDGTGDYIQVKTDGQPGVVTIGVKMIGGGNTSTITIQGSADGVTFTDIDTLTISGSQNYELTLETANAFDANDRYVRMLFTKGSNIGVGPITIAKGTVPSINVAPATFDLEAVGDLNGMQVASGFVTYNNIDITQASDFHIQFYNAEGVEQDQPEWILGAAVSQIANSYQVACMVGQNTGAARSTYFKVYALNGEELVYSNLVTINQAAAQTQTVLYSYSINGNEGETFEVEEGATITLNQGENLNDDFTFAGWTTDANDVSQRLSGEYTLTEEVTVFYAVYAHTTTIGSTVTRDGASYVKVTSTDDLEDGNYLIVYEEGGVAFNGSLETLDDTENTIEVTIDNDVIAANNDVNGAAFTIAAIDGGYSIMSMSGKYIGQTSNNNGMVAGENVITNTISIDGEDADIVSSSAHLRYNSANNQLRFRYYKSSSYSNQKAIQLYKYTTGETPTPTPQPVTETNYYTRVFFTSEAVTSDIQIIGPSIVPSGNQLDMFSALGSYAIINDNPANLIIEGEVLSGEIQFNGTMLKSIAACDYNENNSAGYYLIASPIDNFAPTTDNGFITNQYDLYAYDATQDLEWINYKEATNNFTSLQQNKGYLYASGVNTTLKFAGLLTGYYYKIENLNYAEGENEAKRLTLIGNSSTYMLSCDVVKSQYQNVSTNFLTLNENGDGFVVSESNSFNAEPMESFFVYAYEAGLEVRTWTSGMGSPWAGGNSGTVPGGGGVGPSLPFGSINSNSHLNITVSGTVSGQRGNALLDNAIVSFGQGTTMKKIYLSENSTRVYIPQSNKDYAVVRSGAQGEMPVNFKASKNGSYTLAIDAENVEMDYLHLIDNMTGADVDLLATPSYTFDAKTTDYASRFKLVFSANANENDDENETFAFFNGSVWCISNTGEATLQVVDMLGRIVSSESVNGNATLSTDNLMSGVYMFRLVNGENVKVQKVVVK